jgi:chromate transporter
MMFRAVTRPTLGSGTVVRVRWRRHCRAGEVFRAFLMLGLTSFGGPIAHLGYFRNEFVARRRWLDEKSYADLVALRQFLPGPASSEVSFALGLMRAGPWGAAAAFVAFTLPSAAVLVLFAYGAAVMDGPVGRLLALGGLGISLLD